MKQEFNIDDRKPIWIALSELYLDNELQHDDFKYIAEAIIKSPYSLREVKQIDKFEVFPVLQFNLFSITGEWIGFDVEWLTESITLRIKQKSKLQNLGANISYFCFKRFYYNHWKDIKIAYNIIKSELN